MKTMQCPECGSSEVGFEEDVDPLEDDIYAVCQDCGFCWLPEEDEA